nr:hypothetical protein [Tanacetum cinerariifolium]
DCCCSKGNVEDKILVPKLPKNYARCGHPVDGPYCQGCTFLRKKLKEVMVTHFQDFQNTAESSDDSTNVVNAPREPFIVKLDHRSFVDKIICDLNKTPDSPHLHTFLPNQFHCFHCKDVLGDDYTIAITLVLSTEELGNSLSMGDEHLYTIPTMESNEVIKSSVEDLVPILSESEAIPDTMCDVHLVNNPTPLEAKDHFEIVINSNDDYSSSDNDSLYFENIEYVEALHHDSELVSLVVEKIVIPKDEEIEDKIFVKNC